MKKAGGVQVTPRLILSIIHRHADDGQMDRGARSSPRIAFHAVDLPRSGHGLRFGFVPALGAYQYLLDYYLQWYIAHEPEKLRKPCGKSRASGA